MIFQILCFQSVMEITKKIQLDLTIKRLRRSLIQYNSSKLSQSNSSSLSQCTSISLSQYNSSSFNQSNSSSFSQYNSRNTTLPSSIEPLSITLESDYTLDIFLKVLLKRHIIHFQSLWIWKHLKVQYKVILWNQKSQLISIDSKKYACYLQKEGQRS